MSKFGHVRGLVLLYLMDHGPARSSEIRKAVVAQFPEGAKCATTAITELYYDGLVTKLSIGQNCKWDLRWR